MIEQPTREIALRNLLATLDAGQVPNIRFDGLGNICEGLILSEAGFSERFGFTHGAVVCATCKFISSPPFATSALLGVHPAFTFAAAMSAKAQPHRGVGWAIRNVRKAQKRTLQDVALEVGSDAGNISRIERGSQNAPEPLLRAIAGVLGLTMSELWQLAEIGHKTALSVTAKAGKMTDAQRIELERFADFLLSQEPKK